MATLSDAVSEAFAVAPRNRVVWQTVELRHVAFEVPVRVVTGRRRGQPLTATLEAGAPINGGEAVTFEPFAFRFIPPGVDDNGHATTAKAVLDGVSGSLIEKLDLTLQTDKPIEVTFRTFRDDETAAPGQVISGLFMTNVEVTATAATADLRYKDTVSQGFPLGVYSKALFPALFVQQ